MDVARSSSPAVRRGHAADDVFDALAADVLRGDLEVGAPLPPERVLADRFGVSRLIVRQAVHRLAEVGLVRVRQGAATIVLDPDDASDLRVLSLFYRFAPSSARRRDAGDMIEKQYLQGLSIVEVAARRASDRDRKAIAALVDEASPGDVAAFEERFWRALAAAGKNRVFKMEVAWWYERLPDRPVPRAVLAADGRVRLGFYRELARRLVANDAPTEYYLSVARPILDLALGPRPKARKEKR